MNRKRLIGITFGLLLSFIHVASSHPLDTPTHALINDYVSRRVMDGFSLDSCLRYHLGIEGGIESQIRGVLENEPRARPVWQWLRQGGLREDYSWSRSTNHFHNPLTNEGFSGAGGSGYKSGDSSVVWSQKDAGTQDPGGHYSWYDVRDYLYEALIAKDQVTKENKFAETFRGLGQLMHLVQDLSVPEHARNDGHYIGSLGLTVHYEQWVGNRRNVAITPDPSAPLGGLFAVCDKQIQFVYYDATNINNPNPLGPIPVANLFDSNQYVQPMLGPSTTLHSDIGLSEYTNANFFSPETIFDPRFPFPMIDHCVLTVDSRNNRQYLSNRGPGEHVDHLAAAGWMYYWRAPGVPSGDITNLPIGLDSFCYEEYASRLLPRAVGYSVGLLKYFFRGTLEISPPDRFLYSILDGKTIPQTFKYIKAKVKNTTPREKNNQGEVISYEEMGPGTLVAVAKYKKRTDYKPDLSTDPPTKESREPDFSYSVSTPIGITSLASDAATEFTFNFTNSSIPAGITDLYLQVMFRGTLGNEEDVAVAVGMKDLMEPTHIVLWNCTDRFDFKGQLYTPQEMVELKLDKQLPPGYYIDPYKNLFIAAWFSPNSDRLLNYHAETPLLLPERFSRIIILTDQPSFYLVIAWDSTSPPRSGGVQGPVPAVTYQEDSKGEFKRAPAELSSFRGQKGHFVYALKNAYPPSEGPIDIVKEAALWPPATIQEPLQALIFP